MSLRVAPVAFALLAGCADCPYGGSYTGHFDYQWTPMGGTSTPGVVAVTVTFQCTAESDGKQTLVQVTHASADDAWFGCPMSGCDVKDQSFNLPTNLPVNGANPAAVNFSIALKNHQILPAITSGAINITSGAEMISSSLDPSIAGQTWSTENGSLDDHPVDKWVGWTLNKSAR
jgi:hypothetical protein